MKLSGLLFILLVVECCIGFSHALKILGIFPSMGRSHFFMGEGIMKALHGAGHEVTMISAFPQKKPLTNWTDVSLSGVVELMEEKTKDLNIFEMTKLMIGPFTALMLVQIMEEIVDFGMAHENMKLIYEKKTSFDLVICEVFATDAYLGFAQHYDAPLIVVSTTGSNIWTNDLVGTPEPTSYVPNLLLTFTDDMTFIQRLGNFLMRRWEEFLMYGRHGSKQRALYNKYFPNAKITYDESRRLPSLAFINSHVSTSSPKPYAPNMIEIGGININRNKSSLPKDLEEYIEAAKDGVIYFSLGSHIEASKLPRNTIEILTQTFAKLKQKVLWKLDDASVIKSIPENVRLGKWFPQNEILAHPNVKIFISHGGLLSTTEAVFHGIPIIGMPIAADQVLNIGNAVNLGWAIKVDYATITNEHFEWSINEMLSNPKYKENVKRISEIYRDQPMTPQELVVYWSEYVVRYKGAPHLHSRAVDMSYIAVNNIDVILFLSFVMLVSISITLTLVKKCFRKVFKTKPKKD